MSEEYLTPEKALENLRAIQSVIDGKIEYLDGMRKLATSDLQQHEKRTVEGKLIQLFGRQLAINQRVNTSEKSECCDEVQQFPNIKKWLHVVDVRYDQLQALLQKLGSLVKLLDMPEHEVRVTAATADCNENEVKRLLNAFKNLKKAYLAQHQGSNDFRESRQSCESVSNIKDEDVVDDHVDNHDTTSSISNSASESSSPKQKRPSTSSSISSADSEPYFLPPITPPANEPHHTYFYTITPPPTPTSKTRKPNRTPPPNKRALVNLQIPQDAPQLRRSRSSEAGILHRIDLEGGSSSLSKLRGSKVQAALRSVPGSGSCEAILSGHARRYSEDDLDKGPSSGHSSPQKTSPGRRIASVSSILETLTSTNKTNTLTVPPRSPRMTRKNMVHKIKHRFSKIKLPLQTCNYCHEKVMLSGFRCTDCKYVCHTKCRLFAERLPSCGLPRKFEEFFKDYYDYERSGGSGGMPSPIFVRRSVPPDSYSFSSQDQVSSSAFSQGESSSNASSTTSSTPSSPAPSSITPPSPSVATLDMNYQQHFVYPDVSLSLPVFSTHDEEFGGESIEASVNSDTRTITDSHDSQDPFTDSERTLPEKVEPVDSNVSDPETNDQVLPRKNSKNISEWDIPYEQIEFSGLIGTGRFGPVYRGKWHGDVAIKMLNIEDNEEQLKAFRREVALFKKTRHDFVVLFMGACMRVPHLAIVTSLCKGQTLYTHLHVRKDRFGMNKTVQIAVQIAQGMGYLHAKCIVHKDLKSKNIFIENGKLVITDFALFSIARLSRENRRKDCMVIPNGWLGYLAPELIRSLRLGTEGNKDMELPFTMKSDIYAFGTIWYELLAGEMPFLKMTAESIIWRVGKGMKQSISHLQASRDVKDILMMCWAYSAESRPRFSDITETLKKLPKKRGGLHRSPSHPLHLSRSAESIL